MGKKTKKRQFFNKFKMGFKSFRENPIKSIKQYLVLIKKYYEDNIFFVYFIIVNVINGLLLRYLTLRTIESLFAPQPLMADLGFVVILASIGYLFKHKGRMIYYGVVTVFCTALCLINSAYYTFYSSYASISLLATSKFITEVGDAVIDSVIQIKDFAYLVLPLSLIYVYRRLKKKGFFEKKARLNKSKEKALSSALFGVVTIFLFILTLSSTDIGRFAKQWNREYIVDKFGIYVYHLNDLVKSVEPKISALFGYDEQYQKFQEYFAKEPVYNTNKYTNVFKDKSIIAIHGESIQSFVIGLKVNGVEVTPNLNKLVNDGLYFDNFYTQVSVGTSSDTEFSLNTSLMPSSTGTAFVSFFNREYISIPKLLKEKGYSSFSFHGNSADYWNRRVMHKKLGYDKFYAKDSYEIDEKIGLGLSDGSFLRQTVPFLKAEMEKNEKVYSTVILLTNHTPFYDVSFYSQFDVNLKETVEEDGHQVERAYPYMEDTKLGRYLQSVHYVDQELGNFFNLLDAEGILDKSVIVFYGDHDARLPRKDYERFYNYDKSTNDILDDEDPNYIPFGNYQYELNRKVPLIIYSKNSEYKGRFSYPMAMIDVMPTLGNMFGFRNEYALGHDIFDVKDENTVYFPNGSWLTNSLYYNAKKEEQFTIKESVIDEDYINTRNKKSEELLSVSNAILVYDLLKSSEQAKKEIDEQKVIEGVKQ